MNIRKITVGGQSYVWNRRHTHLKEYESTPCVEKITIYLEGNKKSFLRLFFKEDDNKRIEESAGGMRWCLYCFGDGVAISRTADFPEGEMVSVNFNRPAVIKDIITYFRSHDWNPENTTRPLEIQNAWEYLNRIPLTRG
jgi:hypothetical protein